MAELARAEGALGQPPHPEFNSYHETRWGFGPTPHNVEELVTFAERGTIVDQLNAFAPSNVWDGPSKRSLSDAVIDAVGAAPQVFLDRLPQFLKAKPEYQYAVIAGFKKLWDAWDGKQQSLAWDLIWPKLIDFFEALLTDQAFWAGEVAQEPTLSPTRDWIPPVTAEFLRAGTRSDDKAFAPDLLPEPCRSWSFSSAGPSRKRKPPKAARSTAPSTPPKARRSRRCSITPSAAAAWATRRISPTPTHGRSYNPSSTPNSLSAATPISSFLHSLEPISATSIT